MTPSTRKIMEARVSTVHLIIIAIFSVAMGGLFVGTVAMNRVEHCAVADERV